MLTTRTPPNANALFEEIELCILQEHQPQKDYLSNIKPPAFEFELQEWRYRLCGFLECLHVSNSLSLEHYEKFLLELFGHNGDTKRLRQANSRHFNIKVLDKQFVPYNFDVHALNPIDAYYQLTKRIEYRAVSDISRVDVFTGKLAGRKLEQTPVFMFDKDNLIVP